MHYYEWPPTGRDEAELEHWLDSHHLDAIAYAAHWSDSGHGRGPERAAKDWPECPGFDFEDGLPDWDSGLSEKDGYEYRTVLADLGAYGWMPECPQGWEHVATFAVNPEPELFDEHGESTRTMYLGEGPAEIVYRRSTRYDESVERLLSAAGELLDESAKARAERNYGHSVLLANAAYRCEQKATELAARYAVPG